MPTTADTCRGKISLKHVGLAVVKLEKMSFAQKEQLADEIVRHMAIVARGDRVMTGLLPAIELLAHNVAIGAGARVIRQVGQPIGVEKRVAADTSQHPNKNNQKRFHDAMVLPDQPRHGNQTCHKQH